MLHNVFALFLVLLMVTCTFPSWAELGDVAIFSEATAWISKDDADIQRAIVFDNLKNDVPAVGDVVYATDAEIGPWAEERIDDGKADILITFGWFPTTLYTPGNVQVDNSIAERFLYGGNIILNCADYAFYVTEGGGANGENGLKTIININADMWSDGTAITPTNDGKKYTPALVDFTSHRTFKAAQIVDPWSVEVKFGDNGAGFFDPGIIKLKDSSGRVGICMQNANGDLPRGQVLIEMIDFISQQPDILQKNNHTIGPPDDNDNEVPNEDVNHDGLVDHDDLIAVNSALLTEASGNNADVNQDGIINIADLVLVAAAIATSETTVAAAPAVIADQAAKQLTPADVQRWLIQAHAANLTDATAKRGILFLEHLLSVLTPEKTALLPNYPNPFNPETWIPYQLSEPADVTLTIYDIQGHIVRDLDLGHQAVGIYQHRSRAAYWDGKNAVGEPVASGVYFYTLTAGDFTATRKMLIVK